jgi:outer membrane protein assembly factor BamB
MSLVALPTANAHDPPWTIVSYAYLNIAPSTVGVSQTVAICMWVDTPMPGATLNNDIRRHDYTLTITKPDGTTESKHWDAIADPTSVQFYQYTPTQVGNYTVKFDYGVQTYTWSGAYQNDIFTASSKTKILTVQEEPIPTPITSYPLPTEYWTYPIEGQNNIWYTIASNWLGEPYIYNADRARPTTVQPYGLAPNSAHIMWTKPIGYGGVVGGNDTNVPGETFYNGLSYNARFQNPLIIQGTLFYEEPYGNSGTGGDYIAVDVRTGQELWRITPTAGVPSFGYLYSLDYANQHGVLPNGLLIATSGSTWRAYDPRTGELTTMTITDVPSGSSVAGPSGEYLKYILANFGTSANPNYNLMQWNSSNVFGGLSGLGVANWYSGTANASLPSAYDWNISLSLPQGRWSIGTGGRGAFPLISLNNMMLLTQGTFGGHVSESGATVTTDPGNITAISLKPNTLGQVLWTKTYPPAPGNNTRFLVDWDPDNGVFIFTDKESFERWGYSLKDGSLLWGPIVLPEDTTSDWNFMIDRTERVAYGNLYISGYAGILYCYDVKTGDLQWTYGNGGPGNSTDSGLATPYGRYPNFLAGIADGKIYIVADEHSPEAPMYKGGKLRAINATDGTELWTISFWGNMMNGVDDAFAGGYLATLNTYDMQIYSFGKGPSAMTVEAPMAAITYGSSLVIRGSVTDIAAGTKQPEQAARFPNGVPAVSDASMGTWMEYVYMQKPRPTDVIGVEITLSVLDSNGNYRDIGKTTSDSNGFYSFQWQPDILGKFTVYASFAGSESYWPSHAVTAFAVDEAPEATPPPTPEPASMADLYFIPMSIGILIAIVVVGALVIVLMLRKR